MRNLTAIWLRWRRARSRKDWTRADALREELIAAGCVGPDYRKWHPVFEKPEHRQHRLASR